MKLILVRRYFKDDYTIGKLFINGTYFCDTIEDKTRDANYDGDLNDPGEGKVYGKTAIPYGEYAVDLTMSPKFQRLLPIVEDVPHFTGIRIHRGKTAGDSAGCILPGENKEPGQVIHSTKYEMKLVEWIMDALRKGEKITLRIE